MLLNQVIAEENGKQFKGYLAKPEMPGRAPAMIIMHEVYGVTKGIKEIADKFAQMGFLVLAPNMYWEHDENASFKYQGPNEPMTAALEHDRDAARDLMFNFVKPADGNLTPQNERIIGYINKAADFLRIHPLCDGNVASTGFCFGGRNTYLAMTMGANVDAGIAFYATPRLADVFSGEKASAISKPMMFVVGGEDPYITDIEKDLITSSSGTVITYVAGRMRPLIEENEKGNANLLTLYYGNNNHGWNRANSKYSDPGASEHTLTAAAAFLRAALGKQHHFVVPSIALTMPQSETYRPTPKL